LVPLRKVHARLFLSQIGEKLNLPERIDVGHCSV
jgi:hypothetical protein